MMIKKISEALKALPATPDGYTYVTQLRGDHLHIGNEFPCPFLKETRISHWFAGVYSKDGVLYCEDTQIKIAREDDPEIITRVIQWLKTTVRVEGVKRSE